MSESVFVEYLADSPFNRGRLRNVWNQLEADGTAKRVFCDGTVKDADAFVADLARPGSIVFLVYFEGIPAGIAWFNTLEGRTARGHFAFYKAMWGRKRTAAIGRAVYERVLSLKDNRGYLFDVLTGWIPERNQLAWKLAMLCGGEVCGLIPYGCYMEAENACEDAVVIAVTRDSLARRRNECEFTHESS